MKKEINYPTLKNVNFCKKSFKNCEGTVLVGRNLFNKSNLTGITLKEEHLCIEVHLITGRTILHYAYDLKQFREYVKDIARQYKTLDKNKD